MLVLTTALLAAPVLAPQFEYEVDIHGSISDLSGAISAPFGSAEVGDVVDLHLSFVSDTPCTVSAGTEGHPLTPSLSLVTIEGVAGDVALPFGGCQYIEHWNAQFETLSVDLDFGLAGSGSGSGSEVRIRIADPNLVVGIGIADVVNTPIDVAAVTDPGFDITCEFLEAGVVVATVEVELVDGTAIFGGPIYCSSNPNSTGVNTFLFASGSTRSADNDLTLRARWLPPSSYAFFITSLTSGFIANPAGSAGNLCVLGNIGRFVGPGQILPTGDGSLITLPVDLTLFPTATGPVSVVAGETWHFQAWFRDVTGSTVSNFSDGMRLTFF